MDREQFNPRKEVIDVGREQFALVFTEMQALVKKFTDNGVPVKTAIMAALAVAAERARAEPADAKAEYAEEFTRFCE